MVAWKKKMKYVGSSSLALIMAAGVLAGCAGTSKTTGSNSNKTAVNTAKNQTLRVATTAAVTSFSPFKSSSTEVAYMANAYETLTYATTEGTTSVVKPQLATKWSVSTDGLTWTFTIRQGVRFHDGSIMTAADVANSINKTIQLNQGGAYIWAPVKSVEASGTDQVIFHLKYAAPIDRIASAEYGGWIVGPKGLDQTEDWYNQGHDDGTGPYTIDSYKAGQEVVMKSYKDYWNGWSGPHYDTVINQIVPQSNVQQQMIQGGQVDIAAAIQPQSLATMKSMPNLNVVISPSFYWYNAFFNTQKAPLNNKLVRQALSYAMPYDQIVKVGTSGYGTALNGPLPKGLFPHNDSLSTHPYDLNKAKDLLKQAGFAKGGLNLTLTYAAENPEEALFAPLIKESFSKIGVNLTIKPILWNEQWAMAKGDRQKAQDIFLLLDWPTYSDGAPDLQALYQSQDQTVFNLSYYHNPAYDKMLGQAQNLEVTDPAKATDLFNQLQQMLVDDAPAAFLYQDATEMVLNKSVQGYEGNPSYPFVIFFYQLHP